LGKSYCNAFGGDALQRHAIDVVAHDFIDLKVETDNSIGLIFLRFADQRLDRCQSIRLDGCDTDGMPP
jgi:hypothetical protein